MQDGATKAKKTAYLMAGWVCVGLGIIGAVLPVMPTTCFMIAALFFFSKSSPALAQKLLDHPKFGPPLREWVQHRAIPVEVKIVAVASLMLSAGVVVMTVKNVSVMAMVLVILLGVAIYITTRPSRVLKRVEVQS
jgi:hypothetical protein